MRGRIFRIVDNCSAHRGIRAVQRLQSAYPKLVLVHGPIHASWLNLVEIYFSIAQRKVPTPDDSPYLDALAERLLDFSVLLGIGGQALCMDVQSPRLERVAQETKHAPIKIEQLSKDQRYVGVFLK